MDLPSRIFNLLSAGARLLQTNSAAEFNKGAGKAAFDALRARLTDHHGVRSLALLDGAQDNPAYAATIRSDLTRPDIAADPDIEALMQRLEAAIADLPAAAPASPAVEVASIRPGRGHNFFDVARGADSAAAAGDMIFGGIEPPPGKFKAAGTDRPEPRRH